MKQHTNLNMLSRLIIVNLLLVKLYEQQQCHAPYVLPQGICLMYDGDNAALNYSTAVKLCHSFAGGKVVGENFMIAMRFVSELMLSGQAVKPTIWVAASDRLQEAGNDTNRWFFREGSPVPFDAWNLNQLKMGKFCVRSTALTGQMGTILCRKSSNVALLCESSSPQVEDKWTKFLFQKDGSFLESLKTQYTDNGSAYETMMFVVVADCFKRFLCLALKLCAN